MKAILTLKIDEVGEYEMQGKIGKNPEEVESWYCNGPVGGFNSLNKSVKERGDLDMESLKAFHEIAMPSKNIDIMWRDLLNCGRVMHSSKDISITLKYEH